MQMRTDYIRAIRMLLVLLVTLCCSRAGAAELDEYTIKSGMVFNFIHYIQWPAEALDSAKNLQVCVVGDTSSIRAFYQMQGKSSKERTIAVRTVREPREVHGCNLLYLHRSESRHQSAYLQAAQRNSIVSISDSNGFAAQGGMIGFIEQDGKVRFEINTSAAHKAGIRISSQLLKLAKSVVTP